MAPLGLSLILFLVAVVAALLGLITRRPLLVSVGRPSATVLLLAVLGGLPSSSFGYLVLNFIVLSLVADVALLSENGEPLVVALGLFLVANLCLGLAFYGAGPGGMAPVVGLVIFGGSAFWLTRRLWRRALPAFRGPMVAHMLAVSCMAAAVFSVLAGKSALEIAIIAATGALLLFLAHALLMWSRFARPTMPTRAGMFLLYSAGQLCLVLAARWGVG